MNEDALRHDVTNIDGALEALHCVGQNSEQQSMAGHSADEVAFVIVDTRGRQINPLRTTMTVAEALEDSLGPRWA